MRCEYDGTVLTPTPERLEPACPACAAEEAIHAAGCGRCSRVGNLPEEFDIFAAAGDEDEEPARSLGNEEPAHSEPNGERARSDKNERPYPLDVERTEEPVRSSSNEWVAARSTGTVKPACGHLMKSGGICARSAGHAVRSRHRTREQLDMVVESTPRWKARKAS